MFPPWSIGRDHGIVAGPGPPEPASHLAWPVRRWALRATGSVTCTRLGIIHAGSAPTRMSTSSVATTTPTGLARSPTSRQPTRDGYTVDDVIRAVSNDTISMFYALPAR